MWRLQESKRADDQWEIYWRPRWFPFWILQDVRTEYMRAVEHMACLMCLTDKDRRV